MSFRGFFKGYLFWGGEEDYIESLLLDHIVYRCTTSASDTIERICKVFSNGASVTYRPVLFHHSRAPFFKSVEATTEHCVDAYYMSDGPGLHVHKCAHLAFTID